MNSRLVYLAIWFYKHKMRVIAQFIKNINRIVYAADIAYQIDIGNNLALPHHGLGVVVGPKVILGDNVKICQNVTIGTKRGGVEYNVPIIGSNVLIGSGSVLLGNITVGSNVVIGANSVVLEDVPDNATVAGVPARIVKFNNK